MYMINTSALSTRVHTQSQHKSVLRRISLDLKWILTKIPQK